VLAQGITVACNVKVQVLDDEVQKRGAGSDLAISSQPPAGEKGGTTTMAAERTQNLQDTFLNHVRKNKTPLTIFLVNGVKLQGVVTWFDNFCVLLRRDGHSQLVYKHAISTIMPGHPIQLFEGADEPPGGDKG
jgi:host factor-I protein